MHCLAQPRLRFRDTGVRFLLAQNGLILLRFGRRQRGLRFVVVSLRDRHGVRT